LECRNAIADEEIWMNVSLRSLERDLRGRLRALGRADLADQAVERVGFTDDGSTRYVHIFVRPNWRAYRQGDVYPLAFADYPDLRTLAQWRTFLDEARLLMNDDFSRIVQWLDGR
jgi:hypothetical protein